MLELKPNSRELAAEIDDKQTRINGANAQLVFKNSSYIKVVTASDSARGNIRLPFVGKWYCIHKSSWGKIGEGLTANTEITIWIAKGRMVL